MFDIVYEDGKIFEDCIETHDEAVEILDDAINYMQGDNWCGLHIIERRKDMKEFAVEIKTVVYATVTVFAENEYDAMDMVEDSVSVETYINGTFGIVSDDSDMEIDVSEPDWIEVECAEEV